MPTNRLRLIALFELLTVPVEWAVSLFASFDTIMAIFLAMFLLADGIWIVQRFRKRAQEKDRAEYLIILYINGVLSLLWAGVLMVQFWNLTALLLLCALSIANIVFLLIVGLKSKRKKCQDWEEFQRQISQK